METRKSFSHQKTLELPKLPPTNNSNDGKKFSDWQKECKMVIRAVPTEKDPDLANRIASIFNNTPSDLQVSGLLAASAELLRSKEEQDERATRAFPAGSDMLRAKLYSIEEDHLKAVKQEERRQSDMRGEERRFREHIFDKVIGVIPEKVTKTLRADPQTSPFFDGEPSIDILGLLGRIKQHYTKINSHALKQTTASDALVTVLTLVQGDGESPAEYLRSFKEAANKARELTQGEGLPPSGGNEVSFLSNKNLVVHYFKGLLPVWKPLVVEWEKHLRENMAGQNHPLPGDMTEAYSYLFDYAQRLHPDFDGPLEGGNGQGGRDRDPKGKQSSSVSVDTIAALVATGHYSQGDAKKMVVDSFSNQKGGDRRREKQRGRQMGRQIEGKCWSCGEVGHTSQDCTEPREAEAGIDNQGGRQRGRGGKREQLKAVEGKMVQLQEQLNALIAMESDSSTTTTAYTEDHSPDDSDDSDDDVAFISMFNAELKNHVDASFATEVGVQSSTGHMIPLVHQIDVDEAYWGGPHEAQSLHTDRNETARKLRVVAAGSDNSGLAGSGNGVFKAKELEALDDEPRDDDQMDNGNTPLDDEEVHDDDVGERGLPKKEFDEAVAERCKDSGEKLIQERAQQLERDTRLLTRELAGKPEAQSVHLPDGPRKLPKLELFLPPSGGASESGEPTTRDPLAQHDKPPMPRHLYQAQAQADPLEFDEKNADPLHERHAKAIPRRPG